LPLLIKSGTSSSPSRILIVGSAGHFACPTFTFEKLDDPSTVLSTQYVTSKFLNTVHGMALANQLEKDNVVVHIISPGMTLTSFWDSAPWYATRVTQFLRSLSLGKSIPQAAGTVVLGILSSN
jgi:NAD(P)-dependent dehydrogenase (short-subunit alcohol dehydrogenase family)